MLLKFLLACGKSLIFGKRQLKTKYTEFSLPIIKRLFWPKTIFSKLVTKYSPVGNILYEMGFKWWGNQCSELWNDWYNSILKWLKFIQMKVEYDQLKKLYILY